MFSAIIHIFNLNKKIKNGIKQLILLIGKSSFCHRLRHSYLYQYKYLINIIINYTYQLPPTELINIVPYYVNLESTLDI